MSLISTCFHSVDSRPASLSRCSVLAGQPRACAGTSPSPPFLLEAPPCLASVLRVAKKLRGRTPPGCGLPVFSSLPHSRLMRWVEELDRGRPVRDHCHSLMGFCASCTDPPEPAHLMPLKQRPQRASSCPRLVWAPVVVITNPSPITFRERPAGWARRETVNYLVHLRQKGSSGTAAGR
jgi:hypothetical protein